MGFFRAIGNKRCNVVKNPNWKEVDQLAIYQCDCGVELRTTEDNTSWSS